MRLMIRAEDSQISGALSAIGSDEVVHRMCLELLLSDAAVSAEQIMAMLNDELDLKRKYGAILAKKFENRFPECARELVSSPDPDIYYLAKQR